MIRHEFRVVIDCHEGTAEEFRDAIESGLGQYVFAATTVEHVHTRFPSGMMAYPKRDTIQITDHPYQDTTDKGKCDVCSFGAWLHETNA